MKLTHIVVALLVIAFTVCLVAPQAAFAQDGAAIYKTKCAACHGADGQGKIGPALKGTSMSDAQIAEFLTKGNDAKKAPHKKGISGLSDADAKAVATYVKSLK